MIELKKYIKAGAKLVPAFLILLYLLFFILDSVTTYLATPDLKYEGNWIVVKFNLGWRGIIIKDILIFTLVTSSLIVSMNILIGYSKSNLFNSYKDLIKSTVLNVKLLFSLIVLGIFYSHLINLFHIVINNYLGYFYLHKTEGCLKNFATYYIKNQKYFLFYIQYLLIIPGYLFAIYKMRQINKRIYQKKVSVF